jgi:hypothetical protein
MILPLILPGINPTGAGDLREFFVKPELSGQPAVPRETVQEATAAVPEGNSSEYAARWAAHIDFQRSFSLRPLGIPLETMSEAGDEYLLDPEWFRYSMGNDGLVAAIPATSPEIFAGEAAGMAAESAEQELSFPLGELMAFLEGYAPDVLPSNTRGDMIAVLVILILAVPPLIRVGRGERRRNRALVFHDKRIAA